MNEELMPWNRSARLMVKATDRRLERLRAEEELQRRLDALDVAQPRREPPSRDAEQQP
jgi:hypothetical protein